MISEKVCIAETPAYFHYTRKNVID